MKEIRYDELWHDWGCKTTRTCHERIVEKVLKKIVTMDDMQFGFMPSKGTIDAVFILRRIQEEYLADQKKLCICFVDLE